MRREHILRLTAVCLMLAFFSGCATAPVRKDNIPQYLIGGVRYVPLVSLSDSWGLDLDYDPLSRTVTINKDTHCINLWIDDSLALIDGNSSLLKDPVRVYKGTVVIPHSFKDQVLDSMFALKVAMKQLTPAILPFRKIILDPGHGGYDPGAMGRHGLREKDVNLDIARRLGILLRNDGLEVEFTRSTDRFISLEGRVEKANSEKADFFVSLHSNANRVRSMNGFEVYYVTPKLDNKRAVSFAQNCRLNLENSQMDAPTTNLKATLWDLINTSNRGESISLSRHICKSIEKNLQTPVLGVKEAGYYVLKGATMPAVLVEVGFVSNASEEKYLKNGLYRQRVAEAIREGIVAYGRDILIMEARKSGSTQGGKVQ